MSLSWLRRGVRLLLRVLAVLASVVVLVVGWRIWVLSTAQQPQHADLVRQVFSSPAPPMFTPQHLQLLRALRVWWVPVESGAPGLDASRPLRGPAPALEAAQVLLDTEDEALATRRLAETARWVVPFVRQARLAPGRYAVPADLRRGLPGLEDGHFTLRAEHLTLLRAAQWQEPAGAALDDLLGDSTDEAPLWPMPVIDGKRPYGDFSYYVLDMAELLGQPYARDLRGEFILDPARDAALERLHHETLTALQVLLLYGEWG